MFIFQQIFATLVEEEVFCYLPQYSYGGACHWDCTHSSTNTAFDIYRFESPTGLGFCAQNCLKSSLNTTKDYIKFIAPGYILYCLEDCTSQSTNLSYDQYTYNNKCVLSCSSQSTNSTADLYYYKNQCVQNCSFSATSTNNLFEFANQTGRFCFSDCLQKTVGLSNQTYFEYINQLNYGLCVADCSPSNVKSNQQLYTTIDTFNTCTSECDRYHFQTENYTCVKSCPFFAYNGTCVRKCPKNAFTVLYNNKICIDSCLGYSKQIYRENGTVECASVCPPSLPYVSSGQCVGTCSSKLYSFDGVNKVCISKCSKYIIVLSSEQTVFECGPAQKTYFNLFLSGKNYSSKNCKVLGLFFDPNQNICITFCQSYVVLNATEQYCSDSCNSTYHIFVGGVDYCVDKCSDIGWFYNVGTCVQQCADSEFYVGNDSICIQSCAEQGGILKQQNSTICTQPNSSFYNTTVTNGITQITTTCREANMRALQNETCIQSCPSGTFLNNGETDDYCLDSCASANKVLNSQKSYCVSSCQSFYEILEIDGVMECSNKIVLAKSLGSIGGIIVVSVGSVALALYYRKLWREWKEANNPDLLVADDVIKDEAIETKDQEKKDEGGKQTTKQLEQRIQLPKINVKSEVKEEKQANREEEMNKKVSVVMKNEENVKIEVQEAEKKQKDDKIE